MSFSDGSFDLAGTHRTLHHVPRPDLVVAEMARVTRRGGHVLVVDQLAPDDPAEAAVLHEFETVRDSSHARLLTDAELRELFAANRLVLLRDRHENEERELSAYLDLAGSEGERRARAESLAAADPRLLVELLGWYLLERS
jgi:SAM-dependent methyltransferase